MMRPAPPAASRRRARLGLTLALVGLPLSLALAAPPGREIAHGEHRVLLDLTGQVVSARVPDRPALSLGTGTPGAPVPALGNLQLGRFVSAALLEHKAVLFDEGTQAALALAAYHGSGKLIGRRQLLRLLLQKLDGAGGAGGDAGTDEVLAQLHAAAEVAQLKLPLPERLAGRTRARVVHFRRTDPRAFPSGVGSFSPELAAGQAMDALLTSPLPSSEGATRLARVLQSDPGLRRGFQAQATLRRRLTREPLVHDIFDLLKNLDKRQTAALPNLHFLAPWQGLQGGLIEEVRARKLEGTAPLSRAVLQVLQPAGEAATDAAAGLIAQRRHALGVLARPAALEEARRLRWDASYQPLLSGLVATALELDRPVHVPGTTSSAGGAAGDAPVSAGVMVKAGAIGVYPEISVEPLPTYYLRRALGYRELRRALDELLGPRGVAGLHRITPRGEARRTLDVELREIESLFTGAYLLARRQLGLEASAGRPTLPPGLGQGQARDLALFERWSKDLRADEEVARDNRVMIPLTHDPRLKKTRVLVRLGWSGLPLELAFAVAPKAQVVDRKGKKVDEPRVEFKPIEHTVVYPVTAELLVQNVLAPREMRELCDRYKTADAILKALRQ